MRYIFLWLLAAMPYTGAKACDVCGGAAGSYLGILPKYDQHFVGLSFQYQGFDATHPTMAGQSGIVRSQNYVRSVTAWGRFYPVKRVQVFAFVPYVLNTSAEPLQKVQMQGIGDVKLLANYMLVNTADSSSAIRHTLLLGGGVKAPTGRNDVRNSEGIILSNMQPGTGSWDLLANMNYTVGFGRAGVNADATYKYSTVNRRDYRYGDKLNAGLMGFYRWEQNELIVLPQAGIRYEHSATDLSSYYYRIRNTYSGGWQLYAAGGLTVYYSKLAIGAMVSAPMKQNYAAGLVKAAMRTEVQLQFLL